jgi:ribonuclease Y
LGAQRVAREIRDKIENELTYPGQIKVTVIRELRHSELAK